MSLDARPRDLHGRFAPSTLAESDVTLACDVHSQLARLGPAQVEPLLLEDDGDDAMAADVIDALRRSAVADSAQTWQQALNEATGALPGGHGLMELAVRESCFNCGGRGMDERVGGECYDCGGTGRIFADRILRVRYAPEYQQNR